MTNTNNSSSNGMGLATILFVVFLILKLTGNIDWSWWWVTCPLWLGAAIVLITLAIGGVFFVLGEFLLFIGNLLNKRKKY